VDTARAWTWGNARFRQSMRERAFVASTTENANSISERTPRSHSRLVRRVQRPSSPRVSRDPSFVPRSRACPGRRWMRARVHRRRARTTARARATISTSSMRVVHHASRASRRHPSASTSSSLATPHRIASSIGRGRIHIRVRRLPSHTHRSCSSLPRGRRLRRVQCVYGSRAKSASTPASSASSPASSSASTSSSSRSVVVVVCRSRARSDRGSIDRSIGRWVDGWVDRSPIDRSPLDRSPSIDHPRSTHPSIDHPRSISITIHRSIDRPIDSGRARVGRSGGGTRSWVVFGGLDAEGRHSSGVCVPSAPRARDDLSRASRGDDAGRDEGGDDRGRDHARGARVT